MMTTNARATIPSACALASASVRKLDAHAHPFASSK